MTLRTFSIEVPQAKIVDLHRRLREARFPDQVTGAGWSYGVDVDYLRELVEYWRTRFDWRKQENSLNRFPQFRAKINGLGIHFIHVRGKGPNPRPLVLTHGWPSSVGEFTKVIPLLTDPRAHGGDPEDAFDIVAPSLPGYGFSDAPTRPGMTSTAVTRLWKRLMADVLGYRRFFAHGGDIGAGITNRLGLLFPGHVTAIHTMAAPFRAIGPEDAAPPTKAERKYMAYAARWNWEEGGYSHQQQTRPQTLAAGLNDSPAGLAAWIVEKFRAWSDCGGDVEQRFTKDELLTNISIYWLTGTIASSVRMYYETTHYDKRVWTGEKIEVPARLCLTTEPVDRCPREWAERSYANLSYHRMPKGGHFLAAEEPELLAEDIRTYFRQFR